MGGITGPFVGDDDVHYYMDRGNKRIYSEDGDFEEYFDSYEEMNDWIEENFPTNS